jgi:hypothetical protein
MAVEVCMVAAVEPVLQSELLSLVVLEQSLSDLK